MRLLLLNNNPAVSRLIKLSIDKVGYEMDEFDDYGLVPLKSYDVIMVDNELYDEAELTALGEQVDCEYFLYICQRGSEKPALVNVSLEKPFLPTDFLTLLEKVKNVVDSFKAEEPKEEPIASENSDSKEMQAFDIDEIDTFGIDEENGLDLLEDKENDLDDEDTKEEDDDELPLTLDLEEDNLDNLDMNNDLSDFDFAEEEELITQAKEEVEENKETTESFEEISASILDRDDINEVKQLLDDNEDEDKDEKDEDFSFSFGETLAEEDEEDEELSFDEDLAVEETDEKEDTEEESLELEEISFDEPVEDEDEVVTQAIEKELPLLETQEEMIDDFAEEIEEKIEEEVEEASVQPFVALELADMDSLDVESLDDLNENLLKKAFGEEVEEEKPEESVHEIEVMRGEIESSIARSISGFAQSDILREALKGMKINISITFDEKN